MSGHSIEAAFDELVASPVTANNPGGRGHLVEYRPRHLLMARSLERHLAGRREVVADIGCHDGFFLRLASRFGFGRYLAVDSTQLPPERSHLTGLPGAEFVRANFNADRFLGALPDGSVDCVVSTEVFEHVYHHPLGYLEECRRVLRPGGLLLLTTPNPCTLANAWRLLRGRPVSWGGVAFATTPKITAGNEPLATWDIHFREYAASELADVIGHLAGVQILERGFIGTAAGPTAGRGKRLVKGLVRVAGLSRWRPLCLSQYMVLRKAGG